MIRKEANRKIAILILIVAQFVFVAITWHAFLGAQNQGIPDLIGMLAFFFVLLFPFLLNKSRSIYSFFRFMVIYLAFMPVTGLEVLNGLTDRNILFEIDFGLKHNLILLAEFPKEIIVLLILLYALCENDGFRLKKWNVTLFILVVILAIMMLFLPGISEILLYWVCYFLVILSFHLVENIFLIKKEKREMVVMWTLMIILLIRGCYRMLAIVDTYLLL